jgi:hypothetical protein
LHKALAEQTAGNGEPETSVIGVAGKGPAEATGVDGGTSACGETGVKDGDTSGGRGRGTADGAEGRSDTLTPGVPGKHTRTLASDATAPARSGCERRCAVSRNAPPLGEGAARL